MTPPAPSGIASNESAMSGEARRARAIAWIKNVHDDVTALFTRLDRGSEFREDTWDRAEGGGGHSRVMIDGATFEKGGVNRSVVYGRLPALAAAKLGGRGVSDGESQFFATGVSLVFHPRSPMIPTVHLNVRYFELTDEHGKLTDSWFGGGTDLTPFYPYHEDAATFHRGLRAMCDKHGPKVPDLGPGGDWTCLMSWDDPQVTLPDGWGKFELNVHANGCYTATGPTKLTGFLTISDTTGRDVTNPLFEFDSCFDPHASNAPTGVVFPSALTVTSTALGAGATNGPTVNVSCSLGEKGCAGTVSIRAADGTTATARYDLEPGRKAPLALPGLSAGPAVLAFTPRTGTAPTYSRLPAP